MKPLMFRIRHLLAVWKYERKHGKFSKPEF
jgi:hypothetical protein